MGGRRCRGSLSPGLRRLESRRALAWMTIRSGGDVVKRTGMGAMEWRWRGGKDGEGASPPRVRGRGEEGKEWGGTITSHEVGRARHREKGTLGLWCP
jgi:hypothetical protein